MKKLLIIAIPCICEVNLQISKDIVIAVRTIL